MFQRQTLACEASTWLQSHSIFRLASSLCCDKFKVEGQYDAAAAKNVALQMFNGPRKPGGLLKHLKLG
jgi:hypothetical protein